MASLSNVIQNLQCNFIDSGIYVLAEANNAETYAELCESLESITVQKQVKDEAVKLLLVLNKDTHRLLTFKLPDEECSVMKLLQTVNLCFCQGIAIAYCQNPALDVHYIVGIDREMEIYNEIKNHTIPHIAKLQRNVVPLAHADSSGNYEEFCKILKKIIVKDQVNTVKVNVLLLQNRKEEPIMFHVTANCSLLDLLIQLNICFCRGISVYLALPAIEINSHEVNYFIIIGPIEVIMKTLPMSEVSEAVRDGSEQSLQVAGNDGKSVQSQNSNSEKIANIPCKAEADDEMNENLRENANNNVENERKSDDSATYSQENTDNPSNKIVKPEIGKRLDTNDQRKKDRDIEDSAVHSGENVDTNSWHSFTFGTDEELVAINENKSKKSVFSSETGDSSDSPLLFGSEKKIEEPTTADETDMSCNSPTKEGSPLIFTVPRKTHVETMEDNNFTDTQQVSTSDSPSSTSCSTEVESIQDMEVSSVLHENRKRKSLDSPVEKGKEYKRHSSDSSNQNQDPNSPYVSSDEIEKLRGNGSDITEVNLSPISTSSFYRKKTEEKKSIENQVLSVSLCSRLVKVGTHKYTPKKKIVLSENGLKLHIPTISNTQNKYVDVTIRLRDITMVLVQSEDPVPVLFFYISDKWGVFIRKMLGMQKSKGPYFDPTSTVSAHKRITVVLSEPVTDQLNMILDILFKSQNILQTISPKETKEILSKTSPHDASISPRSELLEKRQKKNLFPNKFDSPWIEMNDKKKKVIKKKVPARSKVPPKTIPKTTPKTPPVRRTLFTTEITSDESPSPRKNIKTILYYPSPSTREALPLNTEDYACLNQGKYINDAIIDFYLKYLFLEVFSESDRNRTHIFSSFFYNRLTSMQECQAEDKNVSLSGRMHASVRNWTKNVNIFQKDFIIIPINESSHWYLVIICFPGLVGKPDTEFSSTIQKKNPCILTFDSLYLEKGTKVITTLRNYLKYEHISKYGVEQVFSEKMIPYSSVKVPQQSNLTDCGLYVLQYVEMFFKDPIPKFTFPIVELRTWFPESTIIQKREEIANLIIKIMKSQAEDKINDLPRITFPKKEAERKKSKSRVLRLFEV